jgi:hypothetical protein
VYITAVHEFWIFFVHHLALQKMLSEEWLKMQQSAPSGIPWTMQMPNHIVFVCICLPIRWNAQGNVDILSIDEVRW